MQRSVSGQIKEEIRQLQTNAESFPHVSCEGVAEEREGFYGLYGGLFFLGILLAIVFICGAVLIMYYKQISEGYEDQARFEILKKVGMTRREIKKSINSQILTVFFLPLLTAGVHVAFAFPMIAKMLMLFSVTNTKFLILVTAGCYLVFAPVSYTHLVSGQLKVAPEHVSPRVLRLMGKPEHAVYEAFSEKFRKVNQTLGKKQYLIPYLISSHPGSTLQDGVALAECVRDMGYMPEQVQDFYPTPSTISTLSLIHI